jgi:hypothetical protein
MRAKDFSKGKGSSTKQVSTAPIPVQRVEIPSVAANPSSNNQEPIFGVDDNDWVDGLKETNYSAYLNLRNWD